MDLDQAAGPRRWNGWGSENTGFPLKPSGLAYLSRVLNGPGPRLNDATLASVLAQVPPSRLPRHPLVLTDAETRVRHARGQSFPDWLAMRSGRFECFPDGVALPTCSDEAGELLRWACGQGFIVIVYGGGTSVAGHVNAPPSEVPVLTLSLARMNTLLALDSESQIATFGAGTPGPALERQLRARGFVLGHFPQSWELSTVGGWVAARSSGQQSLRYGRIEQMFAGARIETLAGSMTIPDVPASAAGPDLREIVLGSEGRMGAITEVKLRVTPLPEHESFHVAFVPDWEAGMTLVRQLAQGKVQLSMMRLSNAAETAAHLALGGEHPLFDLYDRFIGLLGCKDGTRCMFTYGVTGTRRQTAFAQREVRRALRQAGGTALAHGFMGRIWAHSRFRSPYFRNGLWDHGYSVDTFETSINWSRVTATMNAIEQALASASEGEPVLVFSHLSHMYGQGCSIYATCIFRNADSYDALMRRWRASKEAVCAAIVKMGGTISHQHGVGRDHAPWLRFEKGDQGMALLQTLARHFNPDQRLNPGCLLEA